MAVEVGTAYVSIVPSFKGFETALAAGMTGIGVRAGTKVGTEMAQGAKNAGRDMAKVVEAGAAPVFGAMPLRFSKLLSDGLMSSKGMMMAAGAAVGIGAAAIFASATKSAGNFEASMVKLTATAGETGTMTSGNLKIVADGILKLSGDTATSQKQLADGMYLVESAGFHGAQGLEVLKAAAEGARAEQAELPTVTNAVTSALMSYHMSADQSTTITNQMIAAVGHGKMTFEEFSGSLSTVLPVASAAGLSFAEVAGAEATLTNHGTSAREATQELANTIRNLQAPNAQAVKEMDRLGLSSVDIAQHLGQRGLTGTLQMITEAIAKHMGPSGLVLIDTFNRSKTAAADAKTMLDAMPASVRKVAEQFLAGKITINEYQAGIKGLPANQAVMARQFATLVTHAGGFNDLLKKGGPAAQTYTEALKKMLGGATGMNTALMLTGENMPTFLNNVKAIGDAAGATGEHVESWDHVQHTFNFQLEAFHQKVDAAKTSIGLGLLPVMVSLLGSITKVLAPMMSWATTHRELATSIVAIVGGLGAFVAIVIGLSKAAGALVEVMKILRIVTVQEDAALAANPIGIVIVAIVALVAAVIYLWTHFAGFRDFWISVWDGIKTAALFVWNNALKPVFTFIGDHWRLLLAILLPGVGTIIAYWGQIRDAALFLWNNVLRPTWAALVVAWNAVAGAVAAVWNNVLHPVFNVIGAVIGFLWNTIVRPVFMAWVSVVQFVFSAIALVWNQVLSPILHIIGAIVWWLWDTIFKVAIFAIKAEWAGLVVMFTALWNAVLFPFFNFLAGIVRWVAGQFVLAWHEIQSGWSMLVTGVKLLWDTYLHPLFDAVGTVISALWHSTIQPIWNAMKTGWQLLVTGIKAFWDSTLHPLFTTIGDVIHRAGEAVSKAFDGIAGAFASAWDNAKAAVASGWNAIAGWVNDHVINKVNALFHIGISPLPTFATPSASGRSARDRRDYAQGGFVSGPGTSTSDSIPARLSDGEFVLNAAAVARIGLDKLNTLNRDGNLMFINGDASGMTVAIPGFASGGKVSDTKAFIQGQAGKPYVMGATGPDAWDCSGLVGAVYAMLSNKSPYARYFSTVNEADYFKPGLGGPHDLNVGWEGGGGASGHTAGALDGLHFEATPPRVLVGSTNYTPESSLFTGRGHLSVGTQTIWGWLYDHTIGEVKHWIANAINGLTGALPQLGMFTDVLGAMTRQAMSTLTFDNGGWLMPGALALNTTGQPEAVLTPAQSRGLTAAASYTTAGGAPTIVNVYPQAGQSEAEIAAVVSRELAWLRR